MRGLHPRGKIFWCAKMVDNIWIQISLDTEDEVEAVRWAGSDPGPEAMKTRRPMAREPDSLRVSTWPRRTLAENSSPS